MASDWDSLTPMEKLRLTVEGEYQEMADTPCQTCYHPRKLHRTSTDTSGASQPCHVTDCGCRDFVWPD